MEWDRAVVTRGFDYELRRFPPASRGEEGYKQTLNWIRAVDAGFYQKKRSEDFLARVAAAFVADGCELTGAFHAGPVNVGALGPEVPAATFMTYRKTLNVGYRTLIPAHLITWITVGTSHRRRGLLRQLMTEDLAQAKSDGIHIAALTATEASIYRRFGFGAATAEHCITLSTGPHFRLAVPTDGRVDAADPAVLLELAPLVFERAHRATPGSIDRQESYRLRAAGTWEDASGWDDIPLRAALHFDAEGVPDGYVTYIFKGWEVEPLTIEICDLVAATPEAYLSIWDFLGSLDLVRRIVWNEAPVDNPLAWALEDARALRTQAAQDVLWLRILDVKGALEARRYGVDGSFVIDVEDSLELAAGRFLLTVQAGKAKVTHADGERPDLVIDAAELASLYLGGIRATTLREAGRIREMNPDTAVVLERLFAVERPVHCLTHF